MTLIQMPYTVKANFEGYQQLAKICQQAKDAFLETVILDFSQTGFFDAHLAAVLGAIAGRLEDRLNTVTLVNFQQQVEQILRKNDFLSHFGRASLPDAFGTTIQYQTYQPNEEKRFDQYLDTQLLSHPELPGMSVSLKKQIRRQILEVFTNAGLHGDCKRIFSCGQQFPRRNDENLLSFCIVNYGRTIRQNVREYLGQENLSAEDAIVWAVQHGHTTKKATSGGLGLANLVEFLCDNKGTLHIVSSNGFWSLTNGQQFKYRMSHIFQGTIVNMTFNLSNAAYPGSQDDERF